MSYILGLNCYHGDASACILRDGKLIAAIEEERLLRVKHWSGFQINSIKYCLQEAGITIAAVKIVAINSDPKANLIRKGLHVLKYNVSPRLLVDRLKNANARKSVQSELSNLIDYSSFKGSVRYINHHFAHLASAFYKSPYEKAAIL